MTLFEHILIEGRVQDFRNLLGKKFRNDDIQKLIDRDTSKNHKNLMWIGKILNAEPSTDQDELFKNLDLFNKVGTSTDLYSFDDYPEFLEFLKKRSKEVQSGKMAQIKRDSHTISDDKRWQVVVPQTHDASRYFGGGTNWCISTSNKEHWDNYYHKNTIVMIKDRKRKPDDDLFKVALVGNAYDQLSYRYDRKDKMDQLRDFVGHIQIFNLRDRELSHEQRLNYLGDLPDDLFDDIISYFDTDDVYERQNERNYRIAMERFDDDGRDILLDQLFDATVKYLDMDNSDTDVSDFDLTMKVQFKNQIEDGDWEEFLRQLWSACISSEGVDDDDFYPSIHARDLKNLISDTDYSYDTYFDLAREVLKDSDISNMDHIIKDSLIRLGGGEGDRLNPYDVIKRHADSLKDTNYNNILLTSLNMYNEKYNPSFFTGQQTLNLGDKFRGIINKFTPKNIDDVVKVLSINPRAKDMIDMIQKYRRDLYEAKRKLKYKNFFII